MLVNPCLEPQHVYAVASGVQSEVVEHQLAESSPAELGAQVHALDLAVLATEQLDTATASWCAVGTNHEEGHAIGDQLLDAEAMPTLSCI
jgi:hypothetical protein